MFVGAPDDVFDLEQSVAALACGLAEEVIGDSSLRELASASRR
jgi:hypothetical protein